MIISTLLILYSFNTHLITSSSKLGHSYILVIEIPPFYFTLKSIFKGDLFNLIPKPSNSYSIIFLCFIGRVASRTIHIKLQVLATAITYLPLPLPSFAPSIIPGKSNN